MRNVTVTLFPEFVAVLVYYAIYRYTTVGSSEIVDTVVECTCGLTAATTLGCSTPANERVSAP